MRTYTEQAWGGFYLKADEYVCDKSYEVFINTFWNTEEHVRNFHPKLLFDTKIKNQNYLSLLKERYLKKIKKIILSYFLSGVYWVEMLLFYTQGFTQEEYWYRSASDVK